MTQSKEELDNAKWPHEQEREDANLAHSRDDDVFLKANEAAIGSANLVLRTLVVINGGAAITVLAFVGNLLGKSDLKFDIAHTIQTLMYFALGVTFATMSMAFAYFTNYATAGSISSRTRSFKAPYLAENLAAKKWRRAHYAFLWLSVATAFVSLVLFVCGMLAVRNSVSILN